MNYAPTSDGWYQQYADKFSGLNSQAASRETSSSSSGSGGDPQFVNQFNDFPTWMPKDGAANTAQLTQFQKQIPGMFNTGGIEKAYHNQIDGMMAQGRGHAAAAGRAYGQRAVQAGASGAGAGFAQAQAMLPMYGQQNEMLSDLSRIQQSAKQGKAQAMGGVASQLSSMAAQREGMMTDYAQNQQRFALQNKQLQQQMEQWSRSQSRGGGSGGNGGSVAAAQAVLNRPEIHSYALDTFGNPMSANDGTQYRQAEQARETRNMAMKSLNTMAAGRY